MVHCVQPLIRLCSMEAHTCVLISVALRVLTDNISHNTTR